jgi:hypothetical protein
MFPSDPVPQLRRSRLLPRIYQINMKFSAFWKSLIGRVAPVRRPRDLAGLKDLLSTGMLEGRVR